MMMADDPANCDLAQRAAQLEAALAQSDMLLESLPGIHYLFDEEGRLERWNKNLEHITGYASKEISAMRPLDFFVEEDRPRVEKEIHKTFSTGKSAVEAHFLHKQGHRSARHYLTGLCLTINKKRYLAGMGLDISNLRQTQLALKESERRYRHFFEDDLSAAFITKPDGQLIDCNAAFAHMFGFQSPSQLKNINLAAIYPNDSARDEFLALLQKEKRIERYESVMRHVDGSRIHTLENTVGVFDEQDNLVQIRGYLMDITEQKHLELHLQQAQKMEAVGTLAGGIAHDFNNLLMRIQGHTSLLMEEDTHPEHCRHLEGIVDAVKSASGLTRQLLAFARGGQYELKPVDLNTILRKSARMFGRTRKDIRIHFKLQEDLWAVEADATQIEQIMLNLYVNAWQSMPGGGAIYLETENLHLDKKAVRPHMLQNGDYARVTVTDTGVGMRKHVQERIFDPFFTTKEMGQGTGLGLASVYGIIKNHGGCIDVDSKRGQGTSFTLLLPATQRPVIVEAQARKTVKKGKETILLVDDEALVLDVGKQMLVRIGYKVIPADNGQEAIEIFSQQQNEIDAVVLDMVMPAMNGKETFIRLREIDPHVKVLLSSGYSIDGQAREIMNQGCRGFIQKPFDMGLLSRKLREIIE